MQIFGETARLQILHYSFIQERRVILRQKQLAAQKWSAKKEKVVGFARKVFTVFENFVLHCVLS